MLSIVDAQTISPDEYNIVAIPSRVLQQQISDIQKRLSGVLGDAIWLTPSHALHVTVMEITGSHTKPVAQREKRYKQWQVEYGTVTQKIISNFPSIVLAFNQIVVGQHAIIVKAANPDQLNELRKSLLAKTNLPEGTNLPPNIAHITIARFNKEVDLHKITQNAQAFTINHTELITNLSLLKDITPPDFKIKTIDTYQLTT